MKQFENLSSIFINEATSQFNDFNNNKIDMDSQEQYHLIQPKITQLIERMGKYFRM